LYQVALLSKQDMPLAPDVRIGFEMALMRMLAFQPVGVTGETYSSEDLDQASAPTRLANSMGQGRQAVQSPMAAQPQSPALANDLGVSRPMQDSQSTGHHASSSPESEAYARLRTQGRQRFPK